MAIPGLFTSNFNAQETNKNTIAYRSFAQGVSGSAPLLAMLSGVKVDRVKVSQVKWYEDEYLLGLAAVTNNAGTGTQLFFDDASEMLPNSLIENPVTGEFMFVLETNFTTNEVTVHRGVSKTTIVAIDGSVNPLTLQRVTCAYEEASERPTALKKVGKQLYQNMQTVRSAWETSRDQLSDERNETGDLVATSKREAAGNHERDLERQYLFSRSDMLRKDGNKLALSDGLDASIKTNRFIGAAGGTTWDDFGLFAEAISERPIKDAPQEYIAFCGRGPKRWASRMAKLEGEYTLNKYETGFGWSITELRPAIGPTIKLIEHQMFVSSPRYANSLLVFNPAALTLHINRDGELDEYIKRGTNNGKDSVHGNITSKTCITLACESAHGTFSNLNLAAV